MKGYAGQLLFVDLSTGETELRPLDEQMAHDFIGGYGIGAKVLYDEMPAHTPVFAPESMIGFVTGPLNGSAGFFGARYTVVSKSPVYKGWNDANSGGTFGPFMRMAGVDGIFVKGIADHPVYLYVEDGVAEIRDASHLWGKTVMETEAALREELGEKRLGMSLIGPAGERMAWTACVMNDSHRAAGRGGSGAVMGSKKLKAIVCKGTGKVEKFDFDALKALNKEIVEWSKTTMEVPYKMFGQLGTGAGYESSVLSGDASVRNWAGVGITELTEEQIKGPSAANMDELFRLKKYACNSCPLGCGAVYEVDAFGYKSDDSGRPEYETAGGFGSQMLNGDPDVVNVCNLLLNEYGADTISVAGTIAWAMELYSDGVLGLEELDGVDLKWGNGEAIVKMCEKVCRGEGVGAILQNGSRYAAEYFERGRYALCTANGIEIAQHDSRYGPMLARTFVYDPTPGRHVKGGMSTICGNEPPEVKFRYDDKGPADARNTCYTEMNNCGGYCDFAKAFAIPFDHQRKMLNAVTGFDFTQDEYERTGQRIFLMRQAFNVREGFRRKDWYLDDRMLGIPPMEEGPLAGVTVDVEVMGDKFFENIGIDPKTGIPLREVLEELGGMDEVIADIYG